MIRKAALLVLATVFIPLLTYGQSRIERANTNYFNFRPIDAKQIYEQIWRGSIQDDKIAAGKKLANIYWKFYDDYETAKKYMDSLLILTKDNFDILIQITDISIQAEKYENAEKYLIMSLDSAGNDRQIRDSRIKYAEYVLAKSQKNLLSHKSIDTKDVNKAFGFLKDYYLKEPENLNLTKLYLGTVLLLKKDIEIINAWRTYFRIPQNEKAIGLLAKAEGNIRKGLGSNSKDAAVSLVKGLSDSRFFDYAVMMMFQHNLNYKSMADLADIYNYYVFLNNAEGLIYEYYRNKSLGTASDNKYYKDYYSLCIDFWFTLNWENGKPLFFYEKGFEEELFKRFGSKTFTGKGGDQISFFVGHSVVNDSRTIEQYGRQTKITYISMDNVIGNIYPHWYFGFFGIGGWAIENQVIQIRTVPLNNNSPLRAFNRLINEKEREKWLGEIKEKSIKDNSIAVSNPYAILEGLSERLKYRCYSQILDSMKQLNYDDRELKIHFLSSVGDLLVNATVYNHEGRHLLDSYKDYPDNTEMFTSEEREFRAKLSEIAFSKYPKLAFGEWILRQEDPAHENASKRIIKGVVDWMESNKETIQNINTSKPLLPQLYLLTNEQLVEAIRSFDPLYENYIENK